MSYSFFVQVSSDRDEWTDKMKDAYEDAIDEDYPHGAYVYACNGQLVEDVFKEFIDTANAAGVKVCITPFFYSDEDVIENDPDKNAREKYLIEKQKRLNAAHNPIEF